MGGNIHGGHRERMRSRYLQEGADGFADHELLEMLLYGCIPRGDTNALAHHLLNEFGSFSNLIESSAYEIAKVDGVGLKSAVFLTQLHEAVRRYEKEKLENDSVLDSIPHCVEYCRRLLNRCTTERFYMVCVDSSRKVIHVAKMAEGSVGNVYVSNRRMAEVALRYQSAGVVFCHNHPGGRARPSGEDISLTNTFRQILDYLDIPVFDHIIIGENGRYYSFFENGLLKDKENEEAYYNE